MAIRRDDPLRPLLLAVNAARALGVLCLALGLLAILAIDIMGGPRRPGTVFFIATIAIAAVLLLPGTLYLVLAVFVRRFRPWAVVATLVLASLQAALMGFDLAAGIARGGQALALIFVGVLFVASAMLIVYCAQSFPVVIRMQGPPQQAGFEPLMPTPAVPLTQPRSDGFVAHPTAAVPLSACGDRRAER